MEIFPSDSSFDAHKAACLMRASAGGALSSSHMDLMQGLRDHVIQDGCEALLGFRTDSAETHYANEAFD